MREKKEQIKISLSTFFLIIAIIAICIMGAIIYNMNKEQERDVNNIGTLVNRVHELEIKERENSTEITTNSTKANVVDNNANTNEVKTSVFTDEQVKNSIQNYFDLESSGAVAGLLDTLKENGKLTFDSSKWTMTGDYSNWSTDVKISDYKAAMLNYVSEKEYEKNWNPTKNDDEIGLEVNSNGYIIPPQGGGEAPKYTVQNIAKANDLTYTATIKSEHPFNGTETLTYNITVQNNDGNCVIDSVVKK